MPNPEHTRKLLALLGPIPHDKSAFRRRMRLHQGWWRTFVLGEPPGPHPQRAEEDVCNTLRDGEASTANFLTTAALRAAQECLTDHSSSGQGIVAAGRLYNNLLSSQPLAFNFFGELKANLALAARVFRRFIPSLTEVEDIRFEYAPSAATHDNSAFDIAIFFRAGKQRGFWGLECKYTDDFSYRTDGATENYGAAGSRNHEAYKQVFDASDRFTSAYEQYAEDNGLNQLFRNELLAAAALHEDTFDIVHTGLFFHHEDASSLKSAARLAGMLRDGLFVSLTYRDLLESIQREEISWAQREWSMLVWARYCDVLSSVATA